MNLRDVFGLTGSLLLLVGIFMPMVRVPVLGHMSYFRIAPEAGTVLAVLVVISLLLVNTRRYRYLWLTGAASLGVTAFGLLQKGSEPQGGAMRHLSNLASQSVELEWGLGAMIIGALLIAAAGIIRLRR